MDKIISIGGTNDPNTITINSNLNREIINYKVNTSIFQNGSLSNMLDANGNNVLELLNHTAGSLSIDKIIKLYNKIYNISAIVGNTPTTYTNDLLKYTGKKVLESYLGFTYNDIHSSVFGLTRINKDNLQSYNLSPNFKDNTIEIPGKPGFTYYDTQIQKFDIKIVCGFENLSPTGLEAMKEWLAVDKIGILTLDEEQYKNYRVKISAPPTFSFIPFDANEYRVDMAGEMRPLKQVNSTISDSSMAEEMAMDASSYARINRGADTAGGIEINQGSNVEEYTANGKTRTYKGEITITFSCLDGYGYSYDRFTPPLDETRKYFQSRNSYLCIGDFKPESIRDSDMDGDMGNELSGGLVIGGARAFLPSEVSTVDHYSDVNEWAITATSGLTISHKNLFIGTVLDYDSYQGSLLPLPTITEVKDYKKFYYNLCNLLGAPVEMLGASDNAAGDSTATATTIDSLVGDYLEDNSHLSIIDSKDFTQPGTEVHMPNYGNIYTYPEFEFFYSERVDENTDTSNFVEIKDTPVVLWIKLGDQDMILKFNLEDTKSGIKIDCQRGLIWKIKNKYVGGIKKYWVEPDEINGLAQDALVYGDYIKLPSFNSMSTERFYVRCQIGNATDNYNQCLIMKTRVPSRYR